MQAFLYFLNLERETEVAERINWVLVWFFFLLLPALLTEQITYPTQKEIFTLKYAVIFWLRDIHKLNCKNLCKIAWLVHTSKIVILISNIYILIAGIKHSWVAGETSYKVVLTEAVGWQHFIQGCHGLLSFFRLIIPSLQFCSSHCLCSCRVNQIR